MIAITSLAPNHINGQKAAIDSWVNHGYKVYSFNHASEIDQLASVYPEVNFISTTRTMEAHFGKKYVSINAMLDWAKDQEDEQFLFINSDILINDPKGLLKLQRDGVSMLKRMDFDEDMTKARKYDHGIDAFLIPKKYLDIFPQSIYCMGQTFWDYWIPFRTVKEGVKLFEIKEPLIYHKKHNVQYSPDQWIKIGRYFQWENDLYKYSSAIHRMSHFIYQTFTKASLEA